jgi:hypothetical protein
MVADLLRPRPIQAALLQGLLERLYFLLLLLFLQRGKRRRAQRECQLVRQTAAAGDRRQQRLRHRICQGTHAGGADDQAAPARSLHFPGERSEGSEGLGGHRSVKLTRPALSGRRRQGTQASHRYDRCG